VATVAVSFVIASEAAVPITTPFASTELIVTVAVSEVPIWAAERLLVAS